MAREPGEVWLPNAPAFGELFRDETELLEARVFGYTVGHNETSPP